MSQNIQATIISTPIEGAEKLLEYGGYNPSTVPKPSQELPGPPETSNSEEQLEPMGYQQPQPAAVNPENASEKHQPDLNKPDPTLPSTASFRDSHLSIDWDLTAFVTKFLQKTTSWSSSYLSITNVVRDRQPLRLTCAQRPTPLKTLMERSFHGVMTWHWPMPRGITLAASGAHGLGWMNVQPGSTSPAVRAGQHTWLFSMGLMQPSPVPIM